MNDFQREHQRLFIESMADSINDRFLKEAAYLPVNEGLIKGVKKFANGVKNKARKLGNAVGLKDKTNVFISPKPKSNLLKDVKTGKETAEIISNKLAQGLDKTFETFFKSNKEDIKNGTDDRMMAVSDFNDDRYIVKITSLDSSDNKQKYITIANFVYQKDKKPDKEEEHFKVNNKTSEHFKGKKLVPKNKKANEIEQLNIFNEKIGITSEVTPNVKNSSIAKKLADTLAKTLNTNLKKAFDTYYENNVMDKKISEPMEATVSLDKSLTGTEAVIVKLTTLEESGIDPKTVTIAKFIYPTQKGWVIDKVHNYFKKKKEKDEEQSKRDEEQAKHDEERRLDKRAKKEKRQDELDDIKHQENVAKANTKAQGKVAKLNAKNSADIQKMSAKQVNSIIKILKNNGVVRDASIKTNDDGSFTVIPK